jgi:5'-3' exonuclease
MGVYVLIVMDFNQICISNIIVQLGKHTNVVVEENMCRHMILNSIRAYRNWRKQLFPYYKANRKKSNEASQLDWKDIFNCLNKIRSEIMDNFNYRTIMVDTAEADDVIATLCNNFHETNKILILSGDKDFRQLQKYPNVKQYDPVHNSFMIEENPEIYLFEHIIRGDSSDGIPNILSADNSFVIGKRQKPITKKRMKELTNIASQSDHPAFRNFLRNQQLIDLSKIPNDVNMNILDSYNHQAGKKMPNNLMNYFMEHRLKLLMESIGDFI